MEAARVDKDEWLHHVWFTDLVKCSTTRDSERAIKRPTVDACFEHFTNEVDVLQPDVLVALTRPVEHELRRAYKAGRAPNDWSQRVVYGRAFRTGYYSPDDREFVRRIGEVLSGKNGTKPGARR